jgi:group I intron endonuclease
VASGIYKITCRSNGKSYIGSAINFTKRWWAHKHDLNAKQHVNIHLQRAWNKYGASNFEFSVIETIDDPDCLLIAEQRWLDTSDNLFNICLVAGSSLGRVASTETKHKMSIARQGKVFTEDTRKKIGEANRHRVISEKTREKQVNAKIGNTYCKGRSMSESTRSKIGAANSVANRGKTRSEEQRRNYSLAAYRRWEKRREMS